MRSARQKLTKHFDITGMKFGLLTAIQSTRYRGKRAFVCRCECGRESIVTRSRLWRGRTKSCGCQKLSKLKVGNPGNNGPGSRDGYFANASYAARRRSERQPRSLREIEPREHVRRERVPVYEPREAPLSKRFPRAHMSWCAMKCRCYSVNHKDYHRYGGRGILVCDRWKSSFANFLSDMGDRPDGLTLERMDNDKGYSPDNCRWATRKEQSNNTCKTAAKK